MALFLTRLSLSLSLSTYTSASRDAYLPVCDYVDISRRALNACRADDSISAYGTGSYTSLFLSVHITVSLETLTSPLLLYGRLSSCL